MGAANERAGWLRALDVEISNTKGEKALLAEKSAKRRAEVAEMWFQRDEEETRRYQAELLEEQPPS